MKYIFSALKNFYKQDDYILNIHHACLNIDNFLKRIENKNYTLKV